MSEDLVVIRQVSPAPAASDYEAIFAALMQTERGRWFLQEYAQRNRGADTKLLLSAIERIESAVCVDRSAQPRRDLRADLMEMAEAITQTRAEVAEIKAEASTSARQAPPRQPPSGDVFAAAERIRDVAWAMRGHGFDPSTCEQIEELAGTILSASALRDPGDRRTRRLGEVLQYLEQRIANLIDSCAEGEAPAACDDPALLERDPLEDEAAPAAMADNRSNSAGVLVTNGWASDGARNEGPSPQIRIADPLTSDRADDAVTTSAPPAAVATVEPVIVEPSTPALPIEAEVAIVAFSAELANFDPTPPPPQPPPARRPADDPLAPLKAMSADELIALFS